VDVNCLTYECSQQGITQIAVHQLPARLITGVTWCEHITPALHQLHWLPVRKRVDFKISALVYHSLAGTAPVYPTDECTPVTDVFCGLLTIEHAWSIDHATSSVTAVLSLPDQRCGTVCLNSFSNKTSPSDNSNDR